jgi:hypothetical protein
MTQYQARSLVCAITMQAVKDYFRATADERQNILRELRSEWMDYITDGMSVNIANELEKHPKEIRARLRKFKED